VKGDTPRELYHLKKYPFQKTIYSSGTSDMVTQLAKEFSAREAKVQSKIRGMNEKDFI